jgi:YHS domain-containing protein
MRVDRFATEHKLHHEGRAVFFCSASCLATFRDDPKRYEGGLAAEGWRPRRALRSRA